MKKALLIGGNVVLKGKQIDVAGHVRDYKGELYIVKDSKPAHIKIGDEVTFLPEGTVHVVKQISRNGWYSLSSREHVGVRLGDIKAISQAEVEYYRMPKNTELIDFCRGLTKTPISSFFNYNKIKLALRLMVTQS